jgi:hypothetical protein
LKSKWPQWPEWSDSEFYFFPKNVGREFEYDADRIKASKERLEALTEALQRGPTLEWHRAQLQEEVDAINLYLDDKFFPVTNNAKTILLIQRIASYVFRIILLI